VRNNGLPIKNESIFDHIPAIEKKGQSLQAGIKAKAQLSRNTLFELFKKTEPMCGEIGLAWFQKRVCSTPIWSLCQET
jgi:lambda repressor-like predicted transcriptional regulator